MKKGKTRSKLSLNKKTVINLDHLQRQGIRGGCECGCTCCGATCEATCNATCEATCTVSVATCGIRCMVISVDICIVPQTDDCSLNAVYCP